MAVKFKGTLRVPDFDLNEIQKQLNDYAVEKVRDGAKEWLRAATERVPIWSGMAQASLLQLSELAGRRLAIAPLRAASRIPQGRALGDARLVVTNGKATISIRVQVPHYVVQETRNVGVSKTAPWQSFDAGNEAFRDFLKTVEPFPLRFGSKTVARF